jgi:hypothetical protein
MDTMSSAANATGRALAKALRDERELCLLTAIADALAKSGYDDPTIIQLYAQGVIDSWQPEKAVNPSSPERSEVKFWHGAP